MKRLSSRRTTLTLPSECLEIAERIARERHLNLSAVVGEALQRGLREEEQAQRSEAVLKAYSRAFASFSADELLLLDGVVSERQTPEKVGRRKRSLTQRRTLARK